MSVKTQPSPLETDLLNQKSQFVQNREAGDNMATELNYKDKEEVDVVDVDQDIRRLGQLLINDIREQSEVSSNTSSPASSLSPRDEI